MRSTRRRLLELLGGAGAAVLAGCGTLPADCGFEVRLDLREDTTVSEDGDWIVDGAVRASFTDALDGERASSVAVVAEDGRGNPLARASVGDLAQADGDAFDDGTCEGDRVVAPFRLAAGEYPAALSVTSDGWERRCTAADPDDGPAVEAFEYVPPSDGASGDLGDWTERRRDCPATDGTATPSEDGESTAGELRPVTATGDGETTVDGGTTTAANGTATTAANDATPTDDATGTGGETA